MGKTDSHEALALNVMRSSIITTFFSDIRILWTFEFESDLRPRAHYTPPAPSEAALR